MVRIEEIREALSRNSGGWVVDENLHNQVRQPNVSNRRRIVCPPDMNGINDAYFIANAPEWIKQLLEQNETLWSVGDGYHKEIVALKEENEQLKMRCEQLAISRNTVIDFEEMFRKKLVIATKSLEQISNNKYRHGSVYSSILADDASQTLSQLKGESSNE